MRFSTLVGAAAVVATMSLAATAAQATPFVSGSFSISVSIDASENPTNVATDTSLTLNPATTATTTPESGSFNIGGFPVGATLNTPAALNFGAGPPPVGFDFNLATIGQFVAATATLSSSGIDSFGNGFAIWDVVGQYTPGNLWDPHTPFNAVEIWTCNQAGGPGNAITCSGTFHATAPSLPEPLTLSIFGAGLAGAAAIRRRRKVRAAA